MVKQVQTQAEQKQARKQQVIAEFADNFDLHFEKRKKELHDTLMKKIQQHERASQATQGGGLNQNPVTIAYSSGNIDLQKVIN